MKLFALLVILSLHTAGLWPNIPHNIQARLAGHATGTQPVIAQPKPAAPPAALPVKTAGQTLALKAAAAYALDVESGTGLYAYHSSERRPIASITKLATALTILSRHRPTESVTIPKLPEYPQEAETLGLVEGDNFTVENLIRAALVPSANDAADALAIWDSGSVKRFTTRMNDKLAEWGIDDARFTGASGLEETGQYSSAAALAKIASLALTNATIRETINYTDVTFTSGQNRTYTAVTTNRLLATGAFYGIKTGFTLAAGECFVGLTKVDGHEVITVVLGSTDRFGDTTALTNWINQTWQWY